MLHFINMMNPNTGGGGSGTIQIGVEGSIADSIGKAPFAYGYSYSWATWIVENNELTTLGNVNIDSVEFFLNTLNSSPYTMSDQKLFLSHSSIPDFEFNLVNVDHSGSTFISDRTQVKSFDVTFNDTQEGTWVKLEFSTPFEYNGTQHLCFDWENDKGSFNFSGPRFDITTKGYSVRYKRSDSNYPSGNCNLDDQRPIMKINYSAI